MSLFFSDVETEAERFSGTRLHQMRVKKLPLERQILDSQACILSSGHAASKVTEGRI